MNLVPLGAALRQDETGRPLHPGDERVLPPCPPLLRGHDHPGGDARGSVMTPTSCMTPTANSTAINAAPMTIEHALSVRDCLKNVWKPSFMSDYTSMRMILRIHTMPSVAIPPPPRSSFWPVGLSSSTGRYVGVVIQMTAKEHDRHERENQADSRPSAESVRTLRPNRKRERITREI